MFLHRTLFLNFVIPSYQLMWHIIWQLLTDYKQMKFKVNPNMNECNFDTLVEILKVGI